MEPMKIETRPSYGHISAANVASAFPRLTMEQARIYAAAPELLAALKGILEEYRADCEAQGESDEDCDSDAYKIARAALKLAKEA